MSTAAAARKTGGLFEGLYKVLMRRNSVYVTFVIAGAFAGEREAERLDLIASWHFPSRAVDYGVHKLWENNNVGKRYEDISVLGQRPTDE
ncbi:cytochrome b-c1 complex subunit 9-like protein [Tanacetum coccineum]